MLVLPHADRLRVDLDQLRERVLQAPRDGNRAAQGHVEIRELLGGQLAGGIDGRARLAHHHVRNPGAQLVDHFRCKDFRLLAGRTVANGDHLHPVLADQLGDGLLRLLDLRLGMRGIDHARIQHAAGRIHHRHFAARAVAGVQAHRHAPLDRRLHQELAQVDGEDLDRSFVRVFRQGVAHLPLDRGENQAAVSVPGRLAHRVRAGGPLLDRDRIHDVQPARRVQRHAHLQEALAFAAVGRQDAVPRQLPQGLPEVVVRLIDGFLLRLGGLADQLALRHRHHAQTLADPGVVRNPLRDDVLCARKRVLRRLHAQFGVDVGFRQVDGVGSLWVLFVDFLREGLQALLPRHGCARLALWPEGTVDVLNLRQGRSAVQGRGDLLGHAARGRDETGHLLAAFLQPAQVFQALRNFAQRLVVQGTVGLLAVPRDKRDGVSLVDQFYDLFHLPIFEVELF